MTPEEILKENNIDYIIRGKDLIISCLNPQHEDIHPSMHVNKETGISHCFSCKHTLNLFTRFNKVLNTLTLKQSSILEKIRKIKPEILNKPIDYQPFVEQYRNISAVTFKKFDVFTSEKDFEGRVVVPITNFKNNIVGFIGRYKHSKLDPKYFIQPAMVDLPLFPSAININSDTLIIVEGIFDLLYLYDNEIYNVITGFGLVAPNKKDKFNVKLHERFMPYKIAGIIKIIILYDGDKAGRKAADKLREGLEDFIFVDIINLPDDIDPNNMSSKQIKLLKEKLNESSSSNKN